MLQVQAATALLLLHAHLAILSPPSYLKLRILI